MKFKYLFAIVVSFIVFCSCDEDTATLGVDMMPVSDLITKNFQTYDVTTQSYAVGDSVLARTSMSYLGKFTDPETGTTIKSDFLAQFHCNEDFALPDTILGDSCTNMEIVLYVDKFVGDSLASFKLSVYELENSLDPESEYYTNIKPENFYNPSSDPIATKWYTISDRTITDSARWSSSYYRNIRISLPHEMGTSIIQTYRKDPTQFASTSNWLKSGLPCSKGCYFKLENGNGAMAYIDVSQLNIYFRYKDTETNDTVLGLCQLAATEEVVEATRFENENLEKLLNDEDATYLKCPAGVFTMATIPADQINVNDTVNSAKITFTRYNDTVTDSEFHLGIPNTLLMVRLDDYLNGYFEKYSLPDNITSYLASFKSSTNSYTYTNISRLVKTMVNEKNNGTATANWNKVLLIPVETTQASNTIVKLNHDFSMSSSKLVGGKGGKVKLEVIYSHFNNNQ